MTLGERIRWYRRRLGWSQEEMALHVGCHRNTIGRTERGVTFPSRTVVTFPSRTVLTNMSRALRVPMKVLLAPDDYSIDG